MVLAIEHLALIVADARLAAHFFTETFGLRPLDYKGPEVGARGDRQVRRRAAARDEPARMRVDRRDRTGIRPSRLRGSWSLQGE